MVDAKTLKVMLLVGLFVSLPLAFACRQVSDQNLALTRSEAQTVAENLLDEEPEVQHHVGAVFDGRIELIGYDLAPGPSVEAGEELEITWYWRVINPVDDYWGIFVHIDGHPPGRERGLRQNLDHDPIEGLYPTMVWRAGDIVRDVQRVELDRRFAGTDLTVLLGFWNDGGGRLRVTDPGTGTVHPDPEGPRLELFSLEATAGELPSLTAQRTPRPVTIDGRLNDRLWRDADVSRAWARVDGASNRGLSTTVRALWDDDALYLAFEAEDTHIWATYEEADSALWEEEALELYLDVGGDARQYVQVGVNPRGTMFDALFDWPTSAPEEAAEADLEGVSVAAFVEGTGNNPSDEDDKWSAEVRVPWSAFPDLRGRVGGDTLVRANFVRFDRPGDSEVVTLVWSPVYSGSLHQPLRFGHIRLAGGRQGARGGEEGPPPGTVHALEGTTVRLPQPVVPNRIRAQRLDREAHGQ